MSVGKMGFGLSTCNLSSVLTSIFKAAEKTMDDCFKNNILANCMQQMEKIKEIREFQLCDQHQGNTNLLMKTVGRKAIEEIVSVSLNQNLNEKRKQNSLQNCRMSGTCNLFHVFDIFLFYF